MDLYFRGLVLLGHFVSQLEEATLKVKEFNMHKTIDTAFLPQGPSA